MPQVDARSDPTRGRERAVQLHLLDGPFVVANGRRLVIPEGSEKLLVFVALRNGQAVSRRKVAGTLWPSVTETRAAGNLRTALWRLRSSGIEVLDVTGHTLSIAADTSIDVFTIDAWAGRLVDGTAEQDDLSIRHFHPSAMELLPGWYDEWIIFERERIQQKLLHALEVLSARLAQEGRFGEAIEAAMIATEIDPLRESAQKSLILVHLSEGNFAQAHHAYSEYSRRLESELGVTPTSDLARLVLPASLSEGGRRTGS